MKLVFAVLVLVALLASAGFLAVCHGQVSQDQAASEVADADQTVAGCYLSAANAEKAGANVSSLLLTLDGAGVILSAAHLALANGSFDSAYLLAGKCVSMLQGFNATADGLRDNASHAAFVDFWVNLVGSSVGAVAIVAVGVFIWWFSGRKKGVKAGAA